MAVEPEYFNYLDRQIISCVASNPKLYDKSTAIRIGIDKPQEDFKSAAALVETEFILDPLAVLQPLNG